MQSQLKVDKLSFSYEKSSREILTDISFGLAPGSFVSIIGPNGSGKSTLLKNISAILPPQRGVVLIDGINAYKIKPKTLAQKMAVVPQDTLVQFPFTVLETVLMGRMPHLRRFQGETDQDMAVVKWAMEVTGTWQLKDRSITDVSGGERQRIIVARALAQEPQILLLDEPTAFLDLQHQLGLLELLQNLTRRGRLTVITVLHDLNLAAQFSQQIIMLHRSRIFAMGTPEQVLTAGNIREVYGIEVMVTPNSLTGRFNIIPVSTSMPDIKPPNPRRVHLICGGGTGAQMMNKLVQQGFLVSCGVLNIGDSDWSQAKSLGLPLVAEAPFTGIGEKTYRENQELLNGADIVVVLAIPFGPGNLGNLQQARAALLEGKTVYLVGGAGDIRRRDFTDGQATGIYEEMIAQGARVVDHPGDVLLDLSGAKNQKELG